MPYHRKINRKVLSLDIYISERIDKTGKKCYKICCNKMRMKNNHACTCISALVMLCYIKFECLLP